MKFYKTMMIAALIAIFSLSSAADARRADNRGGKGNAKSRTARGKSELATPDKNKKAEQLNGRRDREDSRSQKGENGGEANSLMQHVKAWERNSHEPTKLYYQENIDNVPSGHATPFAIDGDKDGDGDVFIGSRWGFNYLLVNESDSGWESNFYVELADDYGPIYVGDYSAPTMVNMDDDEFQEIVIGTSEGRLYVVDIYSYYPVEFTYGPIWTITPTGRRSFVEVPGGYAVPTVGDMNGDGVDDLIVGAGDGNVYVFENVGAQNDPTIMRAGILSVDFGDRAAPSLADIDGDGNPDLVVGNAAGDIVVCRGNYGQLKRNERPRVNRESPWEGAELIDINGACWALDLPYELTRGHAKPTVADMDNDGFMDLLVGNEKGEVWLISGAIE